MLSFRHFGFLRGMLEITLRNWYTYIPDPFTVDQTQIPKV